MTVFKLINHSTRLILLAVYAALSSATASAQDAYPDRRITLVVPFPPGSATDAVARKIGEGLQRSLGQPFIVDNKAGADGIVAARNVANAPPDGYTLFITTNTTHSANPNIYRDLPYNPKKDFAAIGGIIRISYMLATRADFPADDFAGFVKAARTANPPLLYGSGNTGSRGAGELLKARLGFDMVHVPYKGSPAALNDLMAGRIDVYFPDPASALGLLGEKKFKVLAVTGARRIKTLSDVPTLMELGVPDFNIVAWVAMFAPAGTPQPIVVKLNVALNALLKEPDTIAFVDRIGSDVMATTPEELATFVDDDTARWAHIVDIAKIERK